MVEDGGGSSNLLFVALALVTAQVSIDELLIELSAIGVVFVAVVVLKALQLIANVLGL